MSPMAFVAACSNEETSGTAKLDIDSWTCRVGSCNLSLLKAGTISPGAASYMIQRLSRNSKGNSERGLSIGLKFGWMIFRKIFHAAVKTNQ